VEGVFGTLFELSNPSRDSVPRREPDAPGGPGGLSSRRAAWDAGADCTAPAVKRREATWSFMVEGSSDRKPKELLFELVATAVGHYIYMPARRNKHPPSS
jgi:hypothetical protein